MTSPETNLFLNKPWGPSGGLHRHRGHCSEPLLLLLPHSPQVGEEEVERAPQTPLCPLVEAEEVGQGCLLLEEDTIYETERQRDKVFVVLI